MNSLSLCFILVMLVLTSRTLLIECSFEDDHEESYGKHHYPAQYDDDDCDKDYNDHHIPHHISHHKYHHDKPDDYDYKYQPHKNNIHYGKGLSYLLKEPLNIFHPKPYHHEPHKSLIPNLHLGHDGHKKNIIVDVDKYIPKVIV